MTTPDLAALGWNDELASWWSDRGEDSLLPGRIVRVDRGYAVVATPAPFHADTFRLEDDVATGDWAAVDPVTEAGPVLVAIFPRRSAIRRRDPSAPGSRPREQVLAANLDTVFVLHALDRPTQLERMERSLVIAWDSGAEPVVVLTKADLVNDGAAEPGVDEVQRSIAAVTPGAAVHAISNVTGAGLDALDRYLIPGRTVALIGESGAGKSTLINRLAGEELLATGATRTGDAKGRHTTTARELVILPGGAILIDTPGLRALGLWDSALGLDLAFPDVFEIATSCKFRDCRHDTEPGCAIRTALESGDLHPRRWESYRKMLAEIEDQARRVERSREPGGRRPPPTVHRNEW
jgi:ribosome biogenesis GTPase